MTATSTVIRGREDVYALWDKRSVIIREQAVGSTIVYPQLPRRATYQNYDLREEYVVARVHTVQEGILWANHHFYQWSALGHPGLKCPPR